MTKRPWPCENGGIAPEPWRTILKSWEELFREQDQMLSDLQKKLAEFRSLLTSRGCVPHYLSTEGGEWRSLLEKFDELFGPEDE
jgi:hypothetical protein